MLKVISHDVENVEIRSGYQIVTPEMAIAWLEKNTNNRPVSDRIVDRYAGSMKRGAWLLTHQGIAFGSDGSLYDGQHRLWAIVRSDTPVKLMVTLGLPPESRANIDGQRSRSVGDNFSILSGIQNAKRLVECANIIQGLMAGSGSFKGTYEQTSSIVSQFKEDLEWAVALPGGLRGIGNAPVRGALAFARKADPQKLEIFGEQLFLGANIKERDPAFVLRNVILGGRKTRGAGSERRDLAVKVLRAGYAFLHNEKLRNLYATEDVVAFFGKATGWSSRPQAPMGARLKAVRKPSVLRWLDESAHEPRSPQPANSARMPSLR